MIQLSLLKEMKKTSILILIASLYCSFLNAQNRTVENRPYTDLRKFHLGVLVGGHLQDIELNNIGPHIYQDEDGNAQQALITADQDRWDQGFTVGVLGEYRINTYFQFRIAPALYFGTRHITFRNLMTDQDNKEATYKYEELKSVYFSTALDLIAAAPRFNNHRPYVMIGLNPMLNLSGNNDEIIKLKSSDIYLESGIGCDFYLPYFKLRPEIKFLYSLTDCIDHNHANTIKDKSMIPYTTSVNKGKSKMIVFTFYFE